MARGKAGERLTKFDKVFAKKVLAKLGQTFVIICSVTSDLKGHRKNYMIKKTISLGIMSLLKAFVSS